MDGQVKQSAFNLLHETSSQSILKAVTEGDTLSLTRLLGEIEELSSHLRDKCARDFLMSRLTSQDTGKTCLMEALLNINGKTPEIVLILLSFTKKHDFLDRFINAEYTEENYRGQTALYIAIDRRQSIIVKYLLDKGADMNIRVQEKNNRSYFGETPLALAACTNQPDVVKLLMENSKTNVAIQDSLGNTVLHALITVSENEKPHNTYIINMYDKIIRNCKDKCLERIKNNEGLKPMQLAAKTGKVEMLKYILSREIKEEENRILSRKITVGASGPVSFSLYDVVGVDTSRPNSILQMLVYNTTIKNRHKLLALEPLPTLLQMKWNKYARYIFFISFVFYFAFNIMLTIFSYRAFGYESRTTRNISTISKFLQFIESFFIVVGALFIIVQEIKALFKLKSSGLQSMVCNAWFHVLFLLQAVLAILSGLHHYVLVTAMALGWTNMLYYTRGFKSLDIYSAMIRRVILNEVLKFILVYIPFLLGFGAALASLTEHCTEGDDCSFYHSFRTTIVELFRLTIGLGNLEMQKNSKCPILFQLLLIIYAILIILLLLKTLITLMSRNLDKIHKENENIWKSQRARTILTYEKGLTIYLRVLLKVIEAIQFSENNFRLCLRVTEAKCTDQHKEVTSAFEGLSQSHESVHSRVTSIDKVDVSKRNEYTTIQMKNEKNAGKSTLIDVCDQ